VRIATPAGRRLLVSGTASIDRAGASVHCGDVQQQIALTMDVVREMVDAQGADFSDVTRATAYFKNLQDAAAYTKWQSGQKCTFFPLLITQADICRDELLFEIELDVATKR
jgi:enamine deaminase RidA (YjgF/YER057c/UK114 family)